MNKCINNGKGSSFEEILEKFRNETNPVTKSSYRGIMMNRLERNQKEGDKLK